MIAVKKSKVLFCITALVLLCITGCKTDSDKDIPVTVGTTQGEKEADKGRQEETKKREAITQEVANHVATAKLAVETAPDKSPHTEAAQVRLENASVLLPPGIPDIEWLKRAVSELEDERTKALNEARALNDKLAKMKAEYDAYRIQQEERELRAQQERMQAESNLAKVIDDLKLKVIKAQEEAQEKMRLLFIKGLYGLSTLSLLAGVVIGVLPLALGISFSLKRGAAIAACMLAAGFFYSAARIISHPWFVPIFVGGTILFIGGSIWWLYVREKDQRDTEDTLKLTAESVEALRKDSPEAVKNFEEIAGRKMDRPNKKIIKKVKGEL